MGTRTVTGTITGGYQLASASNTLSVATTGYIEGNGVYTAHSVESAYQVDNFGRIKSGNVGVYLTDGGTVLNGSLTDIAATIQGLNGVEITEGGGSVTNFATVLAGNVGVSMLDTGSFSNGARFDTTATVSAFYVGVEFLGAGTVVNYGSILQTDSSGKDGCLDLLTGGSITNGARGDTAALIAGGGGLQVADGAATIANQGTIEGVYLWGVRIDDGKVTNGVANVRTAIIEGYDVGVLIYQAAGTVINFGTIENLSATVGSAVDLQDGGVVTNGAAGDHAALIQGYAGVLVSGGAATVTNFGSILGAGGASQYGVSLTDGGHLTNGSASDHAALIQGYGGVNSAAPATVANFGSIVATGDGIAVDLAVGGSVANGSVTDTTALIQGYRGLVVADGGATTNFGTIQGVGLLGGDANAVTLIGGSLSNGSANDTIARIDGYVGVYLYGGATLTNFGTIVGQGGLSVYDNYQDPSTVVADPGSVFVGEALMNGGPLQLVGGVVTMGALETSGTVSGAGTLALDGGTSTFKTGANLAISQIAVSGATTLVDAEIANLTDAGTWLQSSGTLDVTTGDKVTFTGSGDAFSGTVAGAGSVVWSGGSDAFSGLTFSAASQTVAGAEVTLSGAIDLTTNMSLTSTNLIVAAGGAILGGTGEFILSANASNSLYGADNAASLIVNGRFYGAGQLGAGQLTLIIGAGGFVDGYTTVALTINTGSNIIQDAGTIYGIGATGTFVDSAVDNTGKLYADGGTLTLEGAVTGSGTGDITSGTLFAASTFNENVTFTASTTGTLELANSQAYIGAVFGFSTTGATTLDLNDIAYGSGTTKATYSGNTVYGILTVTDGTHTAHITLEGNYTASTFTVSSDGHGGTKVVDPSKAPAGGVPPVTAPHLLVAAMAGVATGAHVATLQTPDHWRTGPLAAPGVRIA